MVSKSWADFNDEETRKLKARAEGVVRMKNLMNQLDGDATVKVAFKEEFRSWRTGMMKSFSEMKGNTECMYLNLVEAEKKAEALQAELDALKKSQSSHGQKKGATKGAATELTKAKLVEQHDQALKQRTLLIQQKHNRELSDRLQIEQKKFEDAENMHAHELESLENRSKDVIESYQSELIAKNRELEAQKTSIDEARKHIIGLANAIANQAKQVKLLHTIRLRNIQRLQTLNEVVNNNVKEIAEKDGKIALLSQAKETSTEAIKSLKTIVSDFRKELETLKQQAHAHNDKLEDFQSLEKDLEAMKQQAHAQNSKLMRYESLEKELETMKQQARAQLISFQFLEKDRDTLRNAIAAREQKVEERNAEIAALREKDNEHRTQIADLISENRGLQTRATEFTNQATWMKHHKDHVALVDRVRNLNIEIARVRKEVKAPVPHGKARIDQHKEGWVLSQKTQEVLETLFSSNFDFVATHFNRAHHITGGWGGSITAPQQQLPLRQGRIPAGNEVTLFKNPRVVDGASRAIPAVQKSDKQQAGVNFNKNLLTSSSRTDPRATWVPEDKQEQTNRGPSPSKRHGSPKGAEDPKRTKVNPEIMGVGLGLGFVGIRERDDRGAVLGNDADNGPHMGGLVVTVVRSSKAASLVNREGSTY
ncbi:hypothetical protein GRF29_44g279456 [Pseudopithomyces chartarum]|uniref:Uncharacterized protein n=1 Tax=Pseudopithomyces chartarum TaxID=1892770 RepID=A0AAN6LXN3_9PLEO|nr:hypothetical protein GRF29_44g279456 [Pseudopithomyces chartarum]